MNKEPVLIVEFDTPVRIPDEKINSYSAATFSHSYYISDADWQTSFFYDWYGWDSGISNSPINIGSFTSDEFSDHLRVDTLAECESTEGSFYADGQVLYIHYFDDAAYWSVSNRYGMVNGFCNREWIHSDESVSNLAGSVAYQVRLAATDEITRELDVKANGIFLYNDSSSQFFNHDGYFNQYLARTEDDNGYISNQLFGRPYRVLRGFDSQDYSSFTYVFSGTVETYSTPSEERFAISAKDNRARLTNRMLDTKLLTSVYSDLDPELDNTFAARGIGKIVYGKLTPLNTGTETLADPVQYQSDASLTLTSLYVNYGKESTGFNIISTSDWSYSDGVVSVTKSAILEPGETDSIGEVYASCSDTDETIPDVIVNLLERFAGIGYGNSTFVTTTWPTGTGYDGGVWVTDEDDLTIAEALEQLMRGTDDYLTTDGRGRFEYISLATSSTHTISNSGITSAISIIEGSDEFLSSVVLEYNNGQTRLIYDNEEDDLRLSYFRQKQEKIDTPLTSQSDASSLAGDIMTNRGTIVPSAEFNYEDIDSLSLGDAVTWNIEAAKYTDSGGSESYKLWNVVSISPISRRLRLRLRP